MTHAIFAKVVDRANVMKNFDETHYFSVGPRVIYAPPGLASYAPRRLYGGEVYGWHSYIVTPMEKTP